MKERSGPHSAVARVRALAGRTGWCGCPGRGDSQKVHPDSQKVHPDSDEVHPDCPKVHPGSQKVHPDAKKVRFGPGHFGAPIQMVFHFGHVSGMPETPCPKRARNAGAQKCQPEISVCTVFLLRP